MNEHAYVQTVARNSGSNFYLSFFSLPREQRAAITAVYAFCREVDDAVDAPQGESPAEAVRRWRSELARTYEGRPSSPLTRSLAQAIEQFNLTRAYFEGILDGVTMDLAVRRYDDYKSLATYCYHVAGEVGLLCMEIFGYRSERLKNYAITLGTAFQLTNILRDVGSDARQGRIYLPQQDLARFGVEETWISKAAALGENATSEGTLNPQPTNFFRLMAFEAARARELYRSASALPTQEERPALRAAEIMRAIYENVLSRVEHSNFAVFGPRLRVPTLTKIGLAAKVWWGSR